MEDLFKQWLAEKGIAIEAMIFSSPKEWCPSLYIFRFRLPGEDWSNARTTPWGIETFVKTKSVIEEAMQ
jgi:hypothetical protein